MPKDWEAKDTIKKGKYLKPGDCIRSERGSHAAGIIYRVNRLKTFYGGKPHYEVYDINCPEDGPYSTHLDLTQDFTVINSRKEILRFYDVVELHLLRESANLMEYRKELMGIKEKAVEELNKKLRKGD